MEYGNAAKPGHQGVAAKLTSGLPWYGGTVITYLVGSAALITAENILVPEHLTNTNNRGRSGRWKRKVSALSVIPVCYTEQ